jgi:Zn-finger nucleic acid-binding protein
LNEELHDGVHVDICGECGGVWIDWMDGDLGQVSKKVAVPRARVSEAEGGDGGCPVCATPLQVERVGSVSIQRCGECAGAWLSASAVDGLGRGVERGDLAEPEEPFLTRLLDAVARFILPGR